ncbi:MAG TPA: amidohydrolase family protein [Terriglobia bacterium]|nr:amidohydrolase family protein [Terriglobia bacterium]
MSNRYASAGLLLVSLFGVMLFSTPGAAQQADPALLAKIDDIQAIDNHSHTPALTAPGEKDDDYDALPCEPLEPTEPTLTGLPDNSAFLEAWKSLFGYPYNDRSPAHIKELLAAKTRIRRQQGDHYPDWVLDHLGIETEMSNRIAMGRGLDPPRFRWVPFDDTVLFPLDNSQLADATPDRKIFFSREGAILSAYLKALGKSEPPATLDAYLSEVVTPTLESQREAGAVAIKFEAAYLRSLDFEPAAKERAAQVYARWAHAGAPPGADYAILQNYLFRYIAAEAGRLRMPVHIHTGFGCGSYFKLAGSNPLLLESVLDDPALRKTNFVLLHGGAGAYSRWVGDLLMKPNVFTDMSEQTWLLPTRQVSHVVRDWLEMYPDKVMFGTDLSPGTPEIGWEEIGWQTTRSARRALAIALTGMMNDREITRARAEQIARMVLRGTALKLYGWKDTE